MNKVARHIRLALIFFVIVGVVAAMSVFYYRSIMQSMFNECATHLTEIYTQSTKNFLSFAMQNWGCLKDWQLSIARSNKEQDSKKVEAYINEKRKFWQFSYFYFLATDGSYIDSDGSRGKFLIADSQAAIFGANAVRSDAPGRSATWYNDTLDENCTIFFDRLPNHQNIAVAAINVPHGDFNGFGYDAIGVGYLNEDLIRTLNIDSFGGKADCFVVSSDGTVAISTKVGSSIYENYLSYLKVASDLGRKKIAMLQKEWQPFDALTLQSMKSNNKSAIKQGMGHTTISGLGDIVYKYGVLRCKIGGENSFLSYHNMNYGGFVVLGVVSEKDAGVVLRNVQKETLSIIIKVFLLLGVFIVFAMHFHYRRQRQDARIALKYKELLFDILSTNIDDIFILVDGETGRGEYISPNVERLLGLKITDDMDYVKFMSQKTYGTENITRRDTFYNLPLGDALSWNCEHTNFKTGEKRWYHETVYHVNIQNTNKYVFVLSDRTTDRKMMKTLQDSMEAARNANKAKSTFLSNMSHDIRTPMNAIVGFAVLIARNAGDKDRVLEYVKKISSSSNHLLRLINNVLDMSKIESGKTLLSINPFSMQETLDAVFTVNNELAKAKKQNFTLKIEGNPQMNLIGDRLRVSQILNNLVSNAIKYTPVDGKVELIVSNVVKEDSNYERLRFIVRDNGRGMSESFIKTLYEPFSREVRNNSSQVQGTGLGMAITKNFVDLMGGTIFVESAEEKGTTFTVELSFKKCDGGCQGRIEKSERDVVKIASDKTKPLKGLHFLVAEDNELNAQVLTEILAMKGGTSFVVEDGEKALKTFEKSSPGEYSLIFMDVQMPNMDGYEATRRIRALERKDGKTIPIVAMTADAFSEDLQASLKAGMSAHISKPLDVDLMCATVQKLVGQGSSV